MPVKTIDPLMASSIVLCSHVSSSGSAILRESHSPRLVAVECLDFVDKTLFSETEDESIASEIDVMAAIQLQRCLPATVPPLGHPTPALSCCVTPAFIQNAISFPIRIMYWVKLVHIRAAALPSSHHS